MKITRRPRGQTNVSELQSLRSAAISPQEAAGFASAKYAAVSDVANEATRTLAYFNNLRTKRQEEEDKLTAMERSAVEDLAIDELVNDPDRKEKYSEDPEHFRRSAELIYADSDAQNDTFNTDRSRETYRRVNAIDRLKRSAAVAEEEAKIGAELGADRVVALVSASERARNPAGMIDAVTHNDQFVNEKYTQAVLSAASKLQDTLDAEDMAQPVVDAYLNDGIQAGKDAYEKFLRANDTTSPVGSLAMGKINSFQTNMLKAQADDDQRATFAMDNEVFNRAARILTGDITMSVDEVLAELKNGQLSVFSDRVDPKSLTRAQSLISAITTKAKDDTSYADYWTNRELGTLNDDKETRENVDRAISERIRDLGVETANEAEVVAMQEIETAKMPPQSWVDGFNRMSSSPENMKKWIHELKAIRDNPLFSVRDHMNEVAFADAEFVLSAMDDDISNEEGLDMAVDLWWENKKKPDQVAINSWLGKDLPDGTAPAGPVGVSAMQAKFESSFDEGEFNPPGWDVITEAGDEELRPWSPRTTQRANDLYMETAGRIWRAGGTQAQAHRAGTQAINSQFGLIKVNNGWEVMENAPPSHEGMPTGDWQAVADQNRQSIVTGDFDRRVQDIVAMTDDGLAIVSPQEIDPDDITFRMPVDRDEAFSRGEYHMRVYVKGEPAYGEANGKQVPMMIDITPAEIEASRRSIDDLKETADDWQNKYEAALARQEVAQRANLPDVAASEKRKGERAKRQEKVARLRQNLEEEEQLRFK